MFPRFLLGVAVGLIGARQLAAQTNSIGADSVGDAAFTTDTPTLTLGGSLSVIPGGFGLTETVALMDFDLSMFVAGDTITSVGLELDVNGFTTEGVGGPGPPFEVIGFVGDGTVTLEDATAPGTPIGSGVIDSLGVLVFPIDADFVNGVAQTGSFLALRIESTSTSGTNFTFNGDEDFFERPTLSVDFVPVPEASTTTLLGTVAVGALLMARRRRSRTSG